MAVPEVTQACAVLLVLHPWPFIVLLAWLDHAPHTPTLPHLPLPPVHMSFTPQVQTCSVEDTILVLTAVQGAFRMGVESFAVLVSSLPAACVY